MIQKQSNDVYFSKLRNVMRLLLKKQFKNLMYAIIDNSEKIIEVKKINARTLLDKFQYNNFYQYNSANMDSQGFLNQHIANKIIEILIEENENYLLTANNLDNTESKIDSSIKNVSSWGESIEGHIYKITFTQNNINLNFTAKNFALHYSFIGFKDISSGQILFLPTHTTTICLVREENE